jgi:hypothetical protein
MSDAVPTIDCFDVYVHVGPDDAGEEGWKRRIILDSWSNPGVDPGGKIKKPERKKSRNDKKGKSIDEFQETDFLFTSGSNIVAGSWENIINFQFADLSAVAPFRYHSVRSLGWMLYAVCHLRNRMYCRIQEAVFEALLQYFEVDSMEDVQNALKLNLVNRGFIDKTIRPVKATDRWQPNEGMIGMGWGLTQECMEQNAKSWTANPTSQQKKERETNFQRMADLQAINALVSAGITQAYQYKAPEHRETFRRLCIKDSRDPLARRFQARCMDQGVPAELLYDPNRWDVQCERMVGAGNQTLEMLINQQLMEWRAAFEPEAQRVILRDATFSLTKDPQKALELVPEAKATFSSAGERAASDVSKLLQGIPLQPLEGVSELEYTASMLKILAGRVQAGMKRGGMVEPKELQGLEAIAKVIGTHLQSLSKDEQNKDVVRKLADGLKELANLIKAFRQRLEEAMKKQQQNGQSQVDPKTVAKIKEMQMTGAAKREEQAKKAGQKRAEDEVAFQQQMHQDLAEHHANLLKTDMEAAATIRRGMFDGDDEESETSE